MFKIVKKLILLLFVLINIDRVNSQALTVAEVYDLHVGDELGIVKYRTGAPEYRFMKVMKRTEIGTDSLQLTYYVRTMVPTMQGKIFGEDTLTVSIGYLNSPFFKNYVEGDTTIENKIWMYTIQSWDSTYSDACGSLVNWRYYSFSGEPYHEVKETLVYKGLGVLKRWYYSEGGPYSEQRDKEYLEYYIKDGVLCGNKKAFPLSTNQIEHGRPGIIYPNPVAGVLFISGVPEFSFSLTNLQGLELMTGAGTENQAIHIEHLPAGAYFILISNGSTQLSYKVLIE